MKKISIVVPAYNEEGNVEELASQIDLVFQKLDKYDYEIIFVENVANTTALLLATASNSNLIIPQNGSTITASSNQFIKLIWNGSKWLIESYDATIA